MRHFGDYFGVAKKWLDWSHEGQSDANAWCAEVESLKGNEKQHTKRLEGDPPRGNGWSDTRNYNGSWWA